MEKVHLFPVKINKVIKDPEKVPYGVKMINAPEIWRKTQGRGIVIAVIDTGCQIDHDDLKENIIGGYNFTNDDEGKPEIFQDYLGHGTHVAGIVAASNNRSGIIGVAPNASLLILKIIERNGTSSYENLIAAIKYAVAWRGNSGERVSIINISLGGSKNEPELQSVITRAVSHGIIIVAAGGNNGDNQAATKEVLYPGAYNEVFQVGAVDAYENIGHFSNSNSEIDFLAPGINILSTFPYNNYAELSGTSMATPHVTGAIALMLNLLNRKNSADIPNTIYKHLSSNAKPLGNHSSLEGHGLIQLVLENLERR